MSLPLEERFPPAPDVTRRLGGTPSLSGKPEVTFYRSNSTPGTSNSSSTGSASSIPLAVMFTCGRVSNVVPIMNSIAHSAHIEHTYVYLIQLLAYVHPLSPSAIESHTSSSCECSDDPCARAHPHKVNINRPRQSSHSKYIPPSTITRIDKFNMRQLKSRQPGLARRAPICIFRRVASFTISLRIHTVRTEARKAVQSDIPRNLIASPYLASLIGSDDVEHGPPKGS
ncbi:hypothetical protein CBL_03142 [Carabus blaptoides fortunei]